MKLGRKISRLDVEEVEGEIELGERFEVEKEKKFLSIGNGGKEGKYYKIGGMIEKEI